MEKEIMEKEQYVAPQIEVIQMNVEGVIAASGAPTGPSVQSFNRGRSTRNYNSASSSDLEDMISDILQIGD